MQDGQFRFGKPKTDEERRQRHKSLYGTNELPPRGTGRTILQKAAENLRNK